MRNILTKARELINVALDTKELEDIEEAIIYLDSYDCSGIPEAKDLHEVKAMVEHLN